MRRSKSNISACKLEMETLFEGPIGMEIELPDWFEAQAYADELDSDPWYRISHSWDTSRNIIRKLRYTTTP